MAAKKGFIHLGLIVLVLAGLAGAASVATFARNSSTGRSFSIRLDQPRGPCPSIGDVNNDNKLDDNDRVRILEYRASSWSRRAHIPYTISAPTAAGPSSDSYQGHKFYLVPIRGDLNSDGQVDYADARMIKDFLLSRINTFPRCAQGDPNLPPEAPPRDNQGQISLSALHTESTSATIAWTGQISTGGALNLTVWKGDCVHPRNAGEYYSNTGNIANYGHAQLLWWDSPTSSITITNLTPGQRYCAYASSGLRGLNGNEGLPSYSNDLVFVATGSSTGYIVDPPPSNPPSQVTLGISNVNAALGGGTNATFSWPRTIPNSGAKIKIINCQSESAIDEFAIDSSGVVARWIQRTTPSTTYCASILMSNQIISNTVRFTASATTSTSTSGSQPVVAASNLLTSPPTCDSTTGLVRIRFSWTSATGSVAEQWLDFAFNQNLDYGFQNRNVANLTTFNESGFPPNVTIYWRVNTKDTNGSWHSSPIVSFITIACTASSASSTQPAYCKGDFNRNGTIDSSDIAEETLHYRSTNLAYDINNDGQVTVADLTTLVSNFNKTC